jgi:hypothetical protein
MSTPSDRIERYLDQLLAALAGRPADVRRVLTEVESHLYDAVDAGIDRGLDAEAAVEQALARFGSPTQVARRYRRTDVPAPVLRELVLAAVLVVAVGLLAIGASGVLSMGFRAAWGSSFVAGDLPGVTYTAARCDDYERLHPDAPSCAAAAAAHHADEVQTYRLAAGGLGAVVLVGWWLVRRRRTEVTGIVPPGLVPAAATATFGLAGAVLAVEALGSGRDHGAGQWLSAAVISLLVAGLYARQVLRSLSPA